MLSIDIPDFGKLTLLHLVCDFNGTLACDGRLLPGVEEALRAIAADLQVHVVTADTFGRVREEVAGLPVRLCVIPSQGQVQAKLDYIRGLGEGTVVAIGNGRNDRSMLRSAALAIALVQQEGGAAETLSSAHVVCHNIVDALALLLRRERLIATLRS